MAETISRARRGAQAALVSFLSTTIGACAFVRVDESALEVDVRRAEAAMDGCERKGTVSASTQSKVGFVARNETTVAVELERLARNRAVNLDANVIVPEGPVTADGSRDYAAWRCPE